MHRRPASYLLASVVIGCAPTLAVQDSGVRAHPAEAEAGASARSASGVAGGDDHRRSSGVLTVEPTEVIAGTFHRFHFKLPVGHGGLAEGGGIRVELPVAYSETELLFWSRPQTEVPDAPGYVRSHTASGKPVHVRTGGIAGGILGVIVEREALELGDTIYIDYDATAQSLARRVRLRAELRRAGGAAWEPLIVEPAINVLPRSAATLLISTPADVALREPFEAAAVLLDRFGNRATGYRGTVTLSAPDGTTGLPTTYTFAPADSGVHVFPDVRYGRTGFARIEARDERLTARGNYAYVWPTAPDRRRHYGDTHFHTGTGGGGGGFIDLSEADDINTLDLRSFAGLNLGGDHRGNFTTAAEAYRYIRDVMRLDFAAATEHDAEVFDSIAWDESQRISSVFNEPGRFTTFYGYEWTAPVGHHIVLYDQEGGAVIGHQDGDSLPALWNALDEQGLAALTVPHVTWPFHNHGIWEHRHDGYRRVGEIYSLWNSRFLVQPDDHPQRFELGAEDPWSYQYAWRRGHRIGLIGASDNHLGQPGANNYTIYTRHTGGLAGVISDRNDRSSLWEALKARRSYATTGTRIYLDFEADGHAMGSEYRAGSPPELRVRVGGTNELEHVEIIRHDRDGYRIVHVEHPAGSTSEFTFTDTSFSDSGFYYVRVKQVDEYPGRPFSNTTAEMAWSSPIWVEKGW